jgi:ribosomal protein S18 acetylase RimI-like enzyme
MLVADARDFPIGQAWLDLVRSRHDRTGVVWAVRVFPAFQRMGIGACLMKAAESVLRAEGFERAQLGVERSNPRAARFYERLGYTVTGQVIEEHRYTTPDGDEVVRKVDQWVMRKDLG